MKQELSAALNEVIHEVMSKVKVEFAYEYFNPHNIFEDVFAPKTYCHSMWTVIAAIFYNNEL